MLNRKIGETCFVLSHCKCFRVKKKNLKNDTAPKADNAFTNTRENTALAPDIERIFKRISREYLMS